VFGSVFQFRFFVLESQLFLCAPISLFQHRFSSLESQQPQPAPINLFYPDFLAQEASSFGVLRSAFATHIFKLRKPAIPACSDQLFSTQIF
jgi:hypothetical protein